MEEQNAQDVMILVNTVPLHKVLPAPDPVVLQISIVGQDGAQTHAASLAMTDVVRGWRTRCVPDMQQSASPG